MTEIRKTLEDILAHRPDHAILARLRAMRDQGIEVDPDEASAAPIFRIREAIRRRVVQGAYQAGDVAAFRAAFRSVSQARFARALGISVDTLQNWEQGRRQPVGPAKALLRLLARHPTLLLKDLMSAAG
jgi:DNA-binding transcriptional regulator YiaG